MPKDLIRKTKKGRYDHLKAKPKKKPNVIKIIKKVAIILLLAMAITAMIIRIVMKS